MTPADLRKAYERAQNEVEALLVAVSESSMADSEKCNQIVALACPWRTISDLRKKAIKQLEESE